MKPSGMAARYVTGNDARFIAVPSLGRRPVRVEAGEGLAALGELRQQRGRGPAGAVLFLELPDPGVDCLQPDRVAIPHRPAAVGGEPVSVDVNDVDVAGPQGDALLQNSRTLVDEGVDGPLDDLIGSDFARRNAGFAGRLRGEPCGVRVRRRGAPASLVTVPA